MTQSDWLGDLALLYPDRIAVIDAASRRRHSYRSFDDRANQIAHFCEQWVGLMPGDWIGLLSTPSDDVLQIVVAAGKLGLTALLLDPAATQGDLIQDINRYSPRTVFHGLAQADLVRDIWFEVDSVEHFIPLRGAVDTANFEDIVAHYPSLPPFIEREESSPWVCFASQAITWQDAQVVSGERNKVADSDNSSGLITRNQRPGSAPPLHRSDGLAAAIRGLQGGYCVVVEAEAVQVIQPPGETGPVEEHWSAAQRNAPIGRSWLPHEFL